MTELLKIGFNLAITHHIFHGPILKTLLGNMILGKNLDILMTRITNNPGKNFLNGLFITLQTLKKITLCIAQHTRYLMLGISIARFGQNIA